MSSNTILSAKGWVTNVESLMEIWGFFLGRNVETLTLKP